MDIKDIKVRLDSDYPQIVNAADDPKVVAILKDLLSSRQGEIAGILQYFYQSRIANSTDEDVARLLEEVSIVEMGHMELLMNAIVMFGGTPIYNNSRGQYFNASYINYSIKLKDMLDNNIVAEQSAIQDYTNAQRLVSNQSLKDLFARIIEDEQIHLQTFKKLRDSVSFLSI